MKDKNKNRKQKKIVLLLLILLGVSVGFALLSTTLKINGTANIKGNNWDIHWENVVPNQQSTVTAQTPTISNDGTTVTYDVELALPGDFYEFTVDAKNDGSVNGKIDEIRHTINEVTIENEEEVLTPTTLPSYILYTVYYDGTETAPEPGDILAADTKQTYRVRIEYDPEAEVLPATDKVYRITDEIDYVQTKESAIVTANFETDSWSKIKAAYKSDPTQFIQTMEAGTTREVQLDLDNDGTAETTGHVRIANLSRPAECLTRGFSRSACGFVIEFADIITTHNMNSDDVNTGGWPATSMRTYVNSRIYNALPTELKNAIVDTTIISGHGSDDSNNFTSTDKLYLLSTKEVFGKEGTTRVIPYDTAEAETRQLDYYAAINVTTSNASGATKKNGDSDAYWWLRSAYSETNRSFFFVENRGDWSGYVAIVNIGVSPAFRIAN